MTDLHAQVPSGPRRSRRFTTPIAVLATIAAFATPILLTAEPAAAAGPLRAAAAAKSRFIGYAAANSPLANEAAYRSIATTEFSQVTAENAMKWDGTENVDNAFTYANGDAIVASAAANNQVVHGHTLVWHSQTPGWVQGLSATAMRAAMQDHISNVVGHWANNPVVQSWDVVNEVFDENGGMRTSFWYNTLGQSFVADAFRYARAADPDAKLCINDYNVEGINAKSTAMYNLVSSLKSQGVPIDCVGFQTHLAVQYGFPSQMQQNLQRFADLGVTVRITELDVRIELPADSNEIAAQNTYYGNVVKACLAVTACTGVTIWGFTDKYSWIPDTFPGQGQGLIYDTNYSPKSAYTAVLDAFGGAPADTTPPSTPGTPTASGVTSSSATLSWSASTDNVGVTGYDILRAPGTSGGTFAVVGSSTTTSFTNTGLSPSTSYRYQVRAKDAAGNLSATSSAVTVTTSAGTGDTTPPSTPSGLAASGTTSSSTTLTWTASTDNVGVTGYDILRAPGTSGGTFAVVGSSTTTSFTNTGLSASTSYRYQVQAKDAAGNVSTASSAVTVTTTSGGGGGGCSATGTVQSTWNNGYVIQPLTVTNTGTSTITSWTVTFTLPAGHTLTGSWNATFTVSGQIVTAKSISWNGTLAPGASTSFGFQASRPSGDTSVPSGYTCTTP
ncbi:endo-1,4-beta-xylanase [Allocatelliglobosispora scoriae]|uniref:Beta-xylanase n=1 Tax=Allocatelliglobosispora scoriae TaxID=643052 RepID=A0A841BG33_9ACTN|nr:endo-1,4-beta-xylanase [Allocatelliglobosispora scoriae]MBB5868047.1 endo-1,4-beta-xylanase [Allocatelliglobosispora scoriae]